MSDRQRRLLESPYPDGDDIAMHFARAWAESTLRLVKEARDSRERLREAQKQMPSGWDEATFPPLQQAFRESWTRECMLVLSASQLEEWIGALYRARGRKKPKPLRSLRTLRNAIEHTTEAKFDEAEFLARPSNATSEKRGIGALPGGEFAFALHDELMFGVLSFNEIEYIARRLFQDLAEERDEFYADALAQIERLFSRSE